VKTFSFLEWSGSKRLLSVRESRKVFNQSFSRPYSAFRVSEGAKKLIIVFVRVSRYAVQDRYASRAPRPRSWKTPNLSQPLNPWIGLGLLITNLCIFIRCIYKILSTSSLHCNSYSCQMIEIFGHLVHFLRVLFHRKIHLNRRE
jgi:hypothetical protein